MFRRSLTAATTAALVLAPTAAFAQEGETGETPTDTTVEETTDVGEDEGGLSFLADLIDALSSLLAPADAAEETEVDDASDEEVAVEDETDASDEAVTEEESDPLVEARASIALLMESILDGVEVATVVEKAEEGVEGDELENELEDGESHGEIVSTVAHCAPNGQLAKTLASGLENHGQLVSTASQGGTVSFTVPTFTGEGLETTLTGETVDVSHTLTSVAAAEAFCADVETLIAAKAMSLGLPADATAKDIRRAEKDLRKEERNEAKAERKAEREEAKAEREEAKADRSEAKANAKAERDEAKAERSSAKAEKAKGGKGGKK